MFDFKIDPELKNLIPPLSPDEYKGLENSILKEGCRDSIVLWNNVIIDGHNRYEICKKHSVTFTTKGMVFDSKDDVIDWMYSNQLARRNLTDTQRSKMRGDQYNFRKKRWGGDRKSEEISSTQNEDLIKTATKIASEQKVSRATVERDAVFATALNKLSDTIGTDVTNKILTENIKSTKKSVIELSEEKNPNVVKKVVERLSGAKSESKSSSLPEVLLEVKKEEKRESNRKEMIEKSKEVQSLPETITLYHGDFLKDYVKLGEGSIDCIITDPPYVKEWLSNYSGFAKASAYVLKPGGFLITYIGHIHMDQILAQMTPHIDYYWVMFLEHAGRAAAVHSKGVQCYMKPILIFQKSPKTMPKRYFSDIIKGSGREKDNHEWQQGKDELKQIFEPFTDPGDIVLDPFMGSGTVIDVAKEMDRIAIGFDIDIDNVNIVKTRVSKPKPL